MQVQAYLYFDGRAAEAIEFYKTALGATVDMQMLFKEGPTSRCASARRRRQDHACRQSTSAKPVYDL